MSGPSDIIDSDACLVCGSIFWETANDGDLVCVECGTDKGYLPGTYDWSIYVLSEGDGKLFDLRYGVHELTGLMWAMRKALTHGDIEVKVKTR